MTVPRSVDARSAWLVTIACTAVSMVVAAMAALNTALPDIAVHTGADAGQMTWIIDGYTLALAALLLPAGAVGDRVGRREILILGLLGFGVASLAGMWTDTPTELIVTRVLAGAAAAFIMPTTLSLITAGLPESLRSVGISVWAAVAGGGAIAGFLVTGLLLEFFTWQSIFLTFAAASGVAALLCLTIPTSKDSDPDRFDLPGSATSILAVIGIVGGLLEAPHRGWTDVWVWMALIVGGALAAGFVVIELRSTAPLLDIRLFTNRAFAAGSLSVALQFLASFGLFYLALQQLQMGYGYSPLTSGIALAPFVAVVGVFSLVGNWLAVRFHTLRHLLGGGMAISAVGMLAAGLLDYDSYLGFAGILCVFAVGVGLSAAPSTTAIMANTPLDDQGVGSAVNDTARELGAAIGIALSGSIVATGYAARIGSTAEVARDQLGAAGHAQVAAGDPAGQALIAQADTVAEHVRRSLAEAVSVADHLPGAASPIGAAIRQGAIDAFEVPAGHAYVALAVILFAGAAGLFVLAPRRVVEPEERAEPELDVETT
ncbi:MAG: MFS transporter [Gordonia sp. (in: high G+C Gram-positive bacteria)]